MQPGLALDEKYSVVYKKNLASSNRVTVISGGGSGHEPAHSGYVGDGMLDAAVGGAIFASPNTHQIYRALELAASPKGTIAVVKNYTGDKLNFALAAERFKATTGNDVRMVLVEDDVSVGRSRGKFVGRRGLAGTIFMHKVIGAASKKGYSIDQIMDICEKIAQHMGTIGVSLEPCYVPGQAPHIKNGPARIELGMGIHNEPAINHLPEETPTEEVISVMLDTLLDAQKEEHAFLPEVDGSPGSRVALMINSLGGLSSVELGALTSLVITQLQKTYQIKPCRVFAGTYLSALDGRGFSITLLGLNEAEHASNVLELLDDPTTAIGWTNTIPSQQWGTSLETDSSADRVEVQGTITPPRSVEIPCNAELFKKIVRSIFDEVEAEEPAITRYDIVLGDGDCGTTLLAGAKALLGAVEAGTLETSNLSQGTIVLADVVTEAMGGTSGAIYGIFLSAFAASLSRSYTAPDGITGKYLANAASEALKVLEKFTGARVGDRTLMDALIPVVNEFQVAAASADILGALQKATDFAIAGSEKTRHMQSRFGRSTYVDEKQAMEGVDGATTRIPDPGACGITAILRGIIKAIE